MNEIERLGNEKYILKINELADQYYYLEEKTFILRRFYELELIYNNEGFLFSTSSKSSKCLL